MDLNKFRSPRRRRWLWLAAGMFVFALLTAAAVGYFLFVRTPGITRTRNTRLWTWLTDPAGQPGWRITAGETCQNAPFRMPTDGYIGFLWGDSFRPGHHHQGIDIFGGQDVGLTPVYAVYPGYLTRRTDWKSTVIIRVPDDPLQSGRQIWTYYTHMASAEGESFIVPDFPPGASEVLVDAGTLLGYQGNFSGTPGNPTGVHLHFSIVRDDGQGSFTNELDIGNTIDPSPYLGLPLNAYQNPDTIPVCTDD